jgi:protein-tyrosine phosphatase
MKLMELLAAEINFRDVGGMPAGEGAELAPGLLYRSGLPSLVSLETREAMERDLGVRVVVDIRRLDELDKHPPAEFPHADVVRLPLTPAGARLIIDPEDTFESVVDWYWRQLSLGEQAVGGVFDLLANAGDAGVLVHCHAGKDRTGVVMALVLTSLGVPRASIVADYAASGRNDSDPFFATLPPAYSHAHPEIMEMLLDRVAAEYGSVDGYLKNAGIEDDTIAAVRRRMLRPSPTATSDARPGDEESR